jgi:short-subunit dehydrogenase
MSVAVITGASSGIGEATARLLAKEHGMTLVLVARREERLRELAEELGGSYVAVDLVAGDAPEKVAAHVRERHGRLDLLLNNAGAAWRGTFADEGWENVRRTMELNFDAVVRLTEALLPILRDSARGHTPSNTVGPSIVNVSSTAGRVARPRSGAYSASKFALTGWTDALHLEEKANGVHVGMVLPGFIKTEGFPGDELPSWLPAKPEIVAKAIADCAFNGKAERYVPRPYGIAAALRILTPRLTRRVLSGGSADRLVTSTGADAADRAASASAPPPAPPGS